MKYSYWLGDKEQTNRETAAVSPIGDDRYIGRLQYPPGSYTEYDARTFPLVVEDVKYDSGKSPVFQGALSYFPRAISAVAEVSHFGATKYKWKGWENVPDGYNQIGRAHV